MNAEGLPDLYVATCKRLWGELRNGHTNAAQAYTGGRDGRYPWERRCWSFGSARPASSFPRWLTPRYTLLLICICGSLLRLHFVGSGFTRGCRVFKYVQCTSGLCLFCAPTCMAALDVALLVLMFEAPAIPQPVLCPHIHSFKC